MDVGPSSGANGSTARSELAAGGRTKLAELRRPQVAHSSRAGRRPRLEGLRRKAERRNYLCNLADGALALFALNLVSYEFVVPPFLRKVGASDTLIGLVLSAPPLLTFFLPVLVAGYLNALKFKKPFILVVGVFQRVHFLAAALAAVLLLPDRPTTFLVAFISTLVVNAAAFAVVMPAWADLFAKVTPVARRGTLFAWRWILSVLPIVLFGQVIDRVLEHYAFPADYAILFATAGAFMWLSFAFLALVRERKGEIPGDGARRRSFVRDIPALLRRDRDFAWFLASRLLSQLAFGMVNAFFVLTAATRFGLAPEELLAHYLVLGYGSMVVGCVVLGRTGDRYGHKRNFLLEVPLVVGACVLAILARDPLEFGLVFVLAGFARAVMCVSGLSIVMEFSGDVERPGYVAVYNTIFMPLLLAGPVVGGFTRDYVGVTESFAAAMVLGLAGLAVLVLRVRDPRERARRSRIRAVRTGARRVQPAGRPEGEA